MKNSLLEVQRSFFRNARLRLVFLAVVLGVAWYFGAVSPLSGDELRLWEKVRNAQEYLFRWRESRGIAPETGTDRGKTGFIGVEWSPLTTTLGPLEAKRTAADPLWAVYALRRFRALGIGKNDKVALLSSSSFPGLVYSILAAADHLGADVLWIHSLGASTWGANHPSLPWPVMASVLRQGGFLSRKPDWYTLGGRGEMGGDLPEEGRKILEDAAARENVPFLKASSLAGMIDAKTALVTAFAPRLAVNVGGGAAAFAGNDSDFLRGGLFPPPPEGAVLPGEGVLQRLLEEGIPVLHFLNMKEMASEAGIPYDGVPAPRFVSLRSGAVSAAGVAFFFLFLLFHRRWDRWRP
jgi:poly-gamma-glutamate system protein